MFGNHAHRLAGDAAAIGLVDVEHDARAILEAARTERLAEVPPLLQELRLRVEGHS